MHLHGSAEVNQNGELMIGGVSTVDLAKQYGTPLYIYDTALIRERAKGFKETFKELGVKAEVAYASKAFSCMAIFQLMKEEGLSLDVVSGGELYTALKAQFPSERIHFNGNNKSRSELITAIENKVGCIVVDNFHELRLLSEITAEKKRKMKVLLRVTPGIEAHTHDYILTGQEDSKFGFDLQNGQAEKAVKLSLESEYIELIGLHCHIGSQIFETTGFILAARKMIEKAAEWQTAYGFTPDVINLGGGFGIRYTQEDDPIPPSQYVKEMILAVKEEVSRRGMEMPEIWIEPGRSLVGDAGTSLYTIGSSKEVPGIRKYLAVDGGMSDNIRPALYRAKYEALIANKADAAPEDTVSIAGKCCESGDMLIWDLPLPIAEAGDLLAVFCTGAYGYSMANNYNRLPRPPVVFVENGKAKLVIRRETYQDLAALDEYLT
ncbi:diaminopimelate decarboxylase [Rossellomorea aquimaris]|uniref:Diaminopimelate decarboxylase n=1 Tax=Rossellomorea aquimaris TaxID=189382 RepID=A0A1J6WTE1_9BACI|nr:diaminopimelate decarboxylase [Rossellomorea aquimaris]OIU71175.1 diaminopimelate decarboxylase [Rossellomorea aquimaris]